MAIVMVVDDEKFVQESFSRILAKEGYETKVASNGEETLNLLKEVKPDVILLDFNMPGIDGVEICRRIRSNDETKSIPIIMVTAYPNEKEASLEAGADDFLSKPADPLDVSIRIKYILRIRALNDELEKTKAYLSELRKAGKDWL